MNEEINIENLAALRAFSKNLLNTLNPEKKFQATVIALSGDLGAGKTTFVQNLAKELGVKEIVVSPTFTIMKIYPTELGKDFRYLVHMDAYRIESLEELRPLRLEEILSDKNNLVCIEWAERIKTVLPPDTVYLDIKISTEEKREITVVRPKFEPSAVI